MKHFPDDAWIDFVRGVASPDRVKQLKSHLDACAKCREVHGLWHAVFQIARREERYQPNENATRQAKAMFGFRPGRNSPKRAAARLIFDSFRTALTEGVRSQHPTARRQLQYQFGTLLIDIELSRGFGRSDSTTLLAGHISNRDQAREVRDCRVFLVRGNSLTAQTKTSPLGEFHFEFVNDKECELLVELESNEVFLLSLPDVIAGPSRK